MTLLLAPLAFSAMNVDTPQVVPQPAREAMSVNIFAQVRIERQIIRIRPAPPPSPTTIVSAPQRWKEKGAPDCIKWNNMAAAMVSSPTTLDLIVRGGARFRVRLEKSCSAVDFYSGFYVKMTPDGQICKDRDSIHSRAGGECVIDKFKTLVPAK